MLVIDNVQRRSHDRGLGQEILATAPVAGLGCANAKQSRQDSRTGHRVELDRSVHVKRPVELDAFRTLHPDGLGQFEAAPNQTISHSWDWVQVGGCEVRDHSLCQGRPHYFGK